VYIEDQHVSSIKLFSNLLSLRVYCLQQAFTVHAVAMDDQVRRSSKTAA